MLHGRMLHCGMPDRLPPADGPDCRAQLWQSEVELRGLQYEFAGIAASAITVQDDGEQLGRSERTLAVRPAPRPYISSSKRQD